MDRVAKEYVAVDHHKRTSYIVIMNEQGEIVKEKNVLTKQRFVRAFLGEKNGKERVGVLEAGFNWTVMYDWLSEELDEVQLAHPAKVRAIAEAVKKNDKVDTRTLADLLRGNLIPQVYVPGKETHRAKQTLRHRMFLVRLRTMVKNRIHAILHRYPDMVHPKRNSDAFSVTGLRWMRLIKLSKNDRKILNEELLLYEALVERIRSSDRMIRDLARDDPRVPILESVPGIGKFFAVLLANEIDNISRFRNAKKLVGYAGLAPTTRASGDKCFHGHLSRQRNKWIRWAMIEAVWPAIRKDASLFEYHMKIKSRKGANTAKIAVARRLLVIIYRLFQQGRPYEIR